MYCYIASAFQFVRFGDDRDWDVCVCTRSFQHIVLDYPLVIVVVTHPQTLLIYNYERVYSTMGLSHDVLEHDSPPRVVFAAAPVRGQSPATTIA